MKRRLFNILAAVSLVLCLATAGVWVRSYSPGAAYEGTRVGCAFADGSVCAWRTTQDRFERPEPPQFDDPSSVGPGAFLGFAYVERYSTEFVSEFADPPQPGVPIFSETILTTSALTVPLWFLCTLTAILPAIWLWRYRRDRRARRDGMPHCVYCDYNLTGNVSGICPECGTPVPGDVGRNPTQ